MNSNKTAYIFDNACHAPNMSVPSQYVKSCYNCSDKHLLMDGGISLALSYPDFIPVTNFSSRRREETISIWVSQLPCNYPNYTKDALTRSQEIEKILKDKTQSRSSEFSIPEQLAENLYIIKNSAELSADEEIFYYKTSSNNYKFVTICHSYGCSSASNSIEQKPYMYQYSFSKPKKIEDLVLIHNAVQEYVWKLYNEGKIQKN